MYAEIWPLAGVGQVLERVLRDGVSFTEAETLVALARLGPGGELDTAYFTRTYSPIRGDDGSVVGVFGVVTEMTQSVARVQQLAALAHDLAGCLTVDDVTRTALRHALAASGADSAQVLLSDRHEMRGARRHAADVLNEAEERLPPLWVTVEAEPPTPTVTALHTGRVAWLPANTVTTDPPGGSAANGFVPSRSTQALAALPFLPGSHSGSRATDRGALTLAWGQPREFTSAEQNLLLTVTSLIAQAWARAREYDRERRVGNTLQLSLLPARLPDLAGVSLGSRYEPAASNLAAGGDFYDAFTLDDGRLVLALGDVVGHDAAGAALMGQTRAGLRALARQWMGDPASELRADAVSGDLRAPDAAAETALGQILAGMDRLVVDMDPDRFVTCVLSVVDPASGRFMVASAGHLPPLMRRAGGEPGSRVLHVPVEPGPPLGIPGARPLVTGRLAEGDLLLLFSGGLVKRRRHDTDEGVGVLRAAMEELPDDADGRAAAGVALDAALQALGRGEDDIAVLTLRRARTEHRRRTRLELPGDPRSASRARRFTRNQLSQWDLPALEDAALLIVSEFVTNGTLHARGSIVVELEATSARLLVSVTDHGTDGELALGVQDPEAVRGRGLGLVDVLSESWGAERTSRGTTVWAELATT